MFKESKLALFGFGIVLAFAFIAVFAPVISPYSPTFEAPATDRFIVSIDREILPVNLTYNPPTPGPTTPTTTNSGGGVWIINSAHEGLIFMNFTKHTLNVNETPFQLGDMSMQLDITQDFGFLPPLRPPLRAVFYIIPGLTNSGQAGPSNRTGLLALLANRTFAVVDPFSKSAVFRANLDFDPQWMGEDPVASGESLVLPIARLVAFNDERSYRYLYAATTNRVVVFEISFVHSSVVQPPSGQTVLDMNVGMSAPPFILYSHHGNRSYLFPPDFRKGPGQVVVLPLSNGTLEILNVDGTLRAWVPLELAGEPATVVGPIGWKLAIGDAPFRIYLPLRSGLRTGLATLDLSSLSKVSEYAGGAPSWVPLGPPTTPTGTENDYVTVAFYDPNEGARGTTHLLRINGTGAPQRGFTPLFPGPIQSYFYVQELSKVFAYSQSVGLWTVDTAGARTGIPQDFGITPTSNTTFVRYAGALAGTLYGSSLIQTELYGVWTDSARGETAVFQLLGTIQTPLPPGTYPSGNTYLLGTDFRGSDILTHLFYGTRVAFIVGLFAALAAVGLGTIVGLLAGYFGKIVDTLLMRTADIFLVLPFLPIVLILAAILRPSVWVIILVIGIVGWPGIARVIRAQVLTLKERPFIDAARVAGASDLRLIFYHIAPNVLPFSFLYMSLGVSGAIITEAALSFLGLGDPSVISWGGMLSQVLTFGGALSAWWWLVPPGLAITVLSLGFYLLGRGFDEIVNPRLRRR